MPSPHLLGIVFALASAIVWGSGDFSGGVAARRHSPFQVTALAAASGIGLLVVCALVFGEGVPSPVGALWAGLAGAAGALGISALYRGLALGNAATVAPTAAVVSAALPVIVGLFTEGMPGPLRLAGFGLALAGLYLVAQPSPPNPAPASAGLPAAAPATAAASDSAAPPQAILARAPQRGLGLGLLAGLGFAGFFILIARVPEDLVFAPLVVARGVMLLLALLLLGLRRLPLPGLRANPVAWLAGALDAGGNVFYVLAQQHTRLDIAVVLSSLYPATTVLLAWLLLKERIAPAQWLGAGLCLVAVGLIAV